MTGSRRRYSFIEVPPNLRDFVGTDRVKVEHYDEGVSANEITYWGAFYELEREKK